MTPEHLLLRADGSPVAAGSVRVGDTMLVLDPSGSNRGSGKAKRSVKGERNSKGQMSVVRVTGVEGWRGGIINPLTGSGRILAGAPTQAHSVQARFQPQPQPPPQFVLASTVFASPGDALGAMAAAPSFFKLGARLFPGPLQASPAVHAAADLVALCTLLLNRLDALVDAHVPAHAGSALALAPLAGWAARGLAHAGTWGLAVGCFAAFDLSVGLGFVAYHAVAHALSSLAAPLAAARLLCIPHAHAHPLLSPAAATVAVAVAGVAFLLPAAATTATAKAKATRAAKHETRRG